jgi:hypothetical protein
MFAIVEMPADRSKLGIIEVRALPGSSGAASNEKPYFLNRGNRRKGFLLFPDGSNSVSDSLIKNIVFSLPA